MRTVDFSRYMQYADARMRMRMDENEKVKNNSKWVEGLALPPIGYVYLT